MPAPLLPTLDESHFSGHIFTRYHFSNCSSTEGIAVKFCSKTNLKNLKEMTSAPIIKSSIKIKIAVLIKNN